MKTAQKLDFTEQDIYCGIDVHLKNWQVSIFSDHGEYKTFTQEADKDRLLRYLVRNFPGASVHCAYEAGFSGYSLCRFLEKNGIRTVVVHPPDIPTTDKERRHKRNKRDARKLARNLRKGDLKCIYIPTEQEIADRALVRVRYQLIVKQTRIKNQIKSFLHFLGVRIPSDFAKRYWSRSFIAWLERLPDQLPEFFQPSAAAALNYYLRELHHLRAQLLNHLRSLRELALKDRYRQDIAHLMQLSGIGFLSAITLRTEIMNIDRFGNFDALACFAGLTPVLGGSGEDETEGPLTPRRSKHLRRILIESAWIAASKNPVLLADFGRLCRRMPKNKAIVRIARKQLARIRFVLKNKTACTDLA